MLDEQLQSEVENLYDRNSHRFNVKGALNIWKDITPEQEALFLSTLNRINPDFEVILTKMIESMAPKVRS